MPDIRPLLDDLVLRHSRLKHLIRFLCLEYNLPEPGSPAAEALEAEPAPSAGLKATRRKFTPRRATPKCASRSRAATSERMARLVRHLADMDSPVAPRDLATALGFNPCQFLKKLVKLGAMASTGATSNRLYARTSHFEKIVAEQCAPGDAYHERKTALGITAGA